MLSLPDYASMLAALDGDLDPGLKRLLADRIADAITIELIDLTHFVVADADDRDEDLLTEIGMQLTVNPIDVARLGDPVFQPHWSWVAKHEGWYEVIITVGDSGFAYVLFLRDGSFADPALAAFVQQYGRDCDGDGYGADQ